MRNVRTARDRAAAFVSAGARQRSLTTIRADESARVTGALGPDTRDYLRDLGIRPGDVVHCRLATPTVLLLRTPAGRAVAVERDRARSVRIGPPD